MDFSLFSFHLHLSAAFFHKELSIFLLTVDSLEVIINCHHYSFLMLKLVQIQPVKVPISQFLYPFDMTQFVWEHFCLRDKMCEAHLELSLPLIWN